MTCKEAEAICLLFKEHLAEVTVSETYLTVISNRTGNTESLKTFADCCGSICCSLATLLDSDCSTYCVCPACILKADGLNFLNKCIYINSCILADGFALLDGGDAILFNDLVYLVNSSLIRFK